MRNVVFNHTEAKLVTIETVGVLCHSKCYSLSTGKIQVDNWWMIYINAISHKEWTKWEFSGFVMLTYDLHSRFGPCKHFFQPSVMIGLSQCHPFITAASAKTLGNTWSLKKQGILSGTEQTKTSERRCYQDAGRAPLSSGPHFQQHRFCCSITSQSISLLLSCHDTEAG